MIGKAIGVLIGALIVMAIGKNNITPSDLGVNNGKLAPLPKSPNAISSQTDDLDKKVEPLDFKKDLQSSKDKIVDIINEYPDTEIKANEENYIHAIFKTKGLKFKDDVEFYFDVDRKLIHFRSASRVGYSDMGVNRERYNEIKEAYYQKR